ncbi:MAG: hypothetical protein ACP5OZ_02930 [Candidatus Woesearchaeota archaeon]
MKSKTQDKRKKECCFRSYMKFYDNMLRKATPTDIFFVKISSLFFGILLVYWIPKLLNVNVWIWIGLFILSTAMALRLVWKK